MLATAPKSNTVATAMAAARAAVEGIPGARVPAHLRQGEYAGAPGSEPVGAYRYPHDFPAHVVRQQYLPDEAAEQILFRPNDQGAEAAIRKRQAAVDKDLGKPPRL